MRHRVLTLVGLTLLGLGTTSNTSLAQDRVAKLGPDHRPLADDFNAAGGKGRLLVVLSPT